MTMPNLAGSLIAASAAVILLLGLIHLLYTFRGHKLYPRDAELEARLRDVSPVITRETTMWKAWVGFNASHSFGAILFGAVYGYLAIVHGSFLFESRFLLALGCSFCLDMLSWASSIGLVSRFVASSWQRSSM